MTTSLPTTTHVDHRITVVANQQRGLVTRSQLRTCGLGTSAIQKRESRGRIHQVAPGVYAVGRSHLDRHAHAVAVVLATGPTSAVTGYCAMALRNIGRWGHRETEVVSTTRHRPIPGAIIHSTTSLPPDEITEFDGIRIVTPERMVVDLADQMTEFQLAYVIQQCRIRCGLRMPRLRRLSGRHRHREGHPRLVAAIQLHLSGSAGTRSSREDNYVDMCRRAGLPDPVVNRRVHIKGERIEMDFCWPDAALCVEVDGGPHALPYYRDRDPSDDERLRSIGIDVLRVPDVLLEWGLAETCRRLGMPVPTWTIDGCTSATS